MENRYDIIIVGAGLVGMSMALPLARAGLNVAVIEHSKISTHLEPEFDGRASAIALGSKIIIDSFGAWQFIAPFAEPILDIRVTEGATPFFLHYDHREVGNDPFGYIVENRYIRQGLFKAAEPLANLTIIDNFSIKTQKTDTDIVTIVSSTDKEISARLLIAADGRNSQARELAGIKIRKLNYNQTAIVCTIEHSLPHHGLAQERFFPIGPFAALPMQRNRSSLVWVEPDERVQIYLELDKDEFESEITERIGDYLGEIKLVGKRFSYPLSLIHAQKYFAQRVAIIGDAAHGMHPIAGQGVNLGFRDVDVLAKLIIKQHSLGLDIGGENLLAEFARLRNLDNFLMLAATDTLNRLFSNNIIPIKIARELGLWAVGKMPPLKRAFMRHAMGLKNNGTKTIIRN